MVHLKVILRNSIRSDEYETLQYHIDNTQITIKSHPNLLELLFGLYTSKEWDVFFTSPNPAPATVNKEDQHF